jgi:hypothetical protein
MGQPDGSKQSGESSERRDEGVSARLPWRYSPPGRRQLLAAASAQLRSASGAGGKAGAKAGIKAGVAAGSKAGGAAGRPTGAGGGYDIDDHIRLAVREESAANLGRAGSRLQAAVNELADFDLADPRPSGADQTRQARETRETREARQALVQVAADALWEYVVQREAVGLTDHDLVSRIYGVTSELWRRMGSVAAPSDAAAFAAAGGRRHSGEDRR